ncbi:MAG: tetratricopeptide repeat protein, partial [Bacteroidota bacterium]
MKLHPLLLSIALTAIPILTTAQETTRETIVSGSVENTTTISEVGLYNGTESEAARKLYNQAADYAENRDFENAEKYYKKAIKNDPKYVEAYDNLALVYRRMGNMEQAIEYYKKSI